MAQLLINKIPSILKNHQLKHRETLGSCLSPYLCEGALWLLAIAQGTSSVDVIWWNKVIILPTRTWCMTSTIRIVWEKVRTRGLQNKSESPFFRKNAILSPPKSTNSNLKFHFPFEDPLNSLNLNRCLLKHSNSTLMSKRVSTIYWSY